MMRLRALRVAEVGRFSDPVSVEKMGDGLNVLSGPNELGKSTLMAALKAVLLAKFDSKTDALRALVPNIGGTPLVEAELEINGKLWRIRKRFLKSPLAQLTDISAGVTLRNADAQTQLSALLAGPADLERFGFLWAEQGDTLKDISDAAVGRGIAGLLESEIDTVVLDARARSVQEAVQAALTPLRTGSGKPTARGAWALSIAALRDAEKLLESAAQRRSEQQSRLDEIAAAQAEREQLMAPVAVAGRIAAISATRARLAKAQEAVLHRRLADEQRTGALAKLQSAEQAHASLGNALAEHSRLSFEDAAATEAAAALRARHTDAVAALAAAEASLVDHNTALARTEAELVIARANAAASEAAMIRDQLAERVTSARKSAATMARARELAAALADVTEARIAGLRTLERDLAGFEAAFAAVVPEVTIEISTGATGVVRIDGQQVTARTVVHPEVPLVLEISGVGRITVAPNPVAVSLEQRVARNAARHAAATALATLGATTLAEAEVRLAERQSADAAVRESQARFSATAPHGIDILVAQHADAALRAVVSSPSKRLMADVAVAVEAARNRQSEAAKALRTAEQVVTAAAAELVRFEAVSVARVDRIAALTARLIGQPSHAALRHASEQDLASARAAFLAANTAAEAWAASLEGSNQTVLSSELAAAERSTASAAARGATLDRTIATLEGALRTAGDENVEGNYVRAQAKREEARRRHDDIETEVNALALLDASFSGLAIAGQAALSAPIRARIVPYLQHIFPGATLTLGDSLVPAQLERGSKSEAHGQLSRGTREQIAILVRLGLSKLLADRGAGVPLLLDDALVYADDGRIAQMFDALELAAHDCQVIVLTCRAQTFAALGRRPGSVELALAPWNPHQTE